MEQQKKTKKSLFWKIVKRTILVILILFVSFILFIRSQWGQDIIITEVTNYISKKTNTKVEIKKFYLTYSGNFLLEGLYLEDKKGDTLIYSENMEASIALMPLIRGNAFHLKALDSEGLKANIYRKDSLSKFNYEFLLDALVSQDTSIQSAEKPLKIKLGKLNFKKIDVSYTDAFLGIESNAKLNTLNLQILAVDVLKMRFDITNAVLADGSVTYHQTKPFTVALDEEKSKLPFLTIQNLDVKKTHITYHSDPEYLELDVTIDALLTKIPELDLEKQLIGIANVYSKNTIIKFQQLAPTVGTTTFEWPAWEITADNIELVNNEITAKTGNTSTPRNVFNAEHIQFKNVDFKANSVAYKPGDTSVSVENLSFIDRSGFEVKNLTTQLQLTNTAASFQNISLRTNNSSINGSFALDYNSINELIQQPNLSNISVNFPSLNVNSKDTYFFSPELKNNPYITALSQKQLKGSLRLKGTLNNLNIPKTAINWGDKTKIDVQGSIKNALDFENLTVDFESFNVTSTKKDAFNFIDSSMLTIELPEKFQLTGSLNGGITNLKTNASLKTSDGTIVVKGIFNNNENIAFNGSFDVDNLALGKILKNEKLGIYSFTTTINGQGSNLNTLDATLATNFKKLSYNGYDFSKLNLDGKITNGNGTVNLDFKDENLDFEMVNTIQLDTVASKIHTVLDLKGINFQTLNLSEEDVRAKLKLEADIVGNSTDQLQIDGKITDLLSVRNNRPYFLGDITFTGKLTDKTTAFDIDSNPIKASLVSNTSVAQLIDELQHKFDNYFKENPTSFENETASNTTMKFNATVKQAPILKDLFLPKLESLKPIAITVDFNAENNSLSAIAKAPKIIYNGHTIDSLDFSLNAKKQVLNFDFELGKLKSGALAIQKIRFDGNLKDKVLYTNFIAKDSSETLIQIASEITREKDSTYLHINPERLILNKQNWTILPNNTITYATDFLGFTNFELSQKEQQVIVSNTFPDETLPHIGFDFKNFKLSTITSIFNQEKLLATGKLNGEFIAENPFGDVGFLAKATITDLEVLEVALGTLKLDAKSLSSSKYDLDLAVSGKNLNLSIIGNYTANEDGAPLDFDIDLKNLELKAMEEFSKTYLSNTSGNISGNFKVSGTTNVPKLLGALKFNNASLTINAFNAAFTLPQESIKIDDTGIYFDQFTMLDTNQNPFVLDGDVTTKELTNPAFALTLKAKNIEVLNSTKEANDLFYGKVNIDADISINGTLQHPKVRGSLEINDASDFTYIIPEEEVNLVEKEGIVIFVNKKNPDDILTNQRDVSSKAILKGYDINAALSVSNKAVFHIIVDERTGDNLKVSGTGDFNFGISESGDMSLSGKYEVTSGHYEVSLYNLVRRHFEIAQGSSIIWRGNPLEADMDIRAIYKIETAASGLMAAQLTGESASVTSKYRQKLPFHVYLNLEGQLLKPEISFNLDIPRDDRGEFGGAVYAQVQQLNSREDELNKQVFSLLVLNQFFPSATNDGSSGGSLSIARDNANNVLSNQLNNFSNRLLGNSGIELDFGLSSYTDYQGNSATDRTQLDINARKRLFNDKLIVEVGSGVDIQENSQNAGQTTPLVGTVNIQYLFDENGRWRLKAYRKNDFENVIDGQVILTGISLIFNQEFNKFEELFAKAVAEEVAKTKESEQTKKDKSKQ